MYDAPITDVIAAAHRITPNARNPNSPAAASNADAVGLAGSRLTPAATTPSTARNSSIRMAPVTSTPVTDAREICCTLETPRTPASTSRCAPAYVMYPPTVPPTSVVMARKSTCSGNTALRNAAPTGGSDTHAT